MSDAELAHLLRPMVRDLLAHGVEPARVRKIVVEVASQALAEARSVRSGRAPRADVRRRVK